MSDVILEDWDGHAAPIHALTEAETAAHLQADAFAGALAATADFKGKPGQVLLVPDAGGGLDRVLFGAGDGQHPTVFRALPAKLPAGVYRIAASPAGTTPDQIALQFALGSYRFDRYKAAAGERPRLLAQGADVAEVRQVARACALARDMINTPANDMGPRQIETIAREIAEQHGARITVIEGEGLLAANYPAVHAVGRAADPARAPRMIEITWGEAGRPLVCLVGKGVVFDSGRSRHQAVGRHAQHEEGHGRRRPRAGAGADDHGRRPAGAARHPHACGRERHLRRRHASGRRAGLAQGDCPSRWATPTRRAG